MSDEDPTTDPLADTSSDGNGCTDDDADVDTERDFVRSNGDVQAHADG